MKDWNPETPVLRSLAQLASLSGGPYRELHAVVARRVGEQDGFPYRYFSVRKRSGGRRWISVPAESLRVVQRWLATHVLNRWRPHAAAYGYVLDRKAPLLSHAQQHCGAGWLVKVDIRDFFGHISERQVYRVFRQMGYAPLMSFELARLCTHMTPGRGGWRWHARQEMGKTPYGTPFVGSLPQGAPSSPALSNLVCRDMDVAMTALALDWGATYSRYADDLCFSFPVARSVQRGRLYHFKRQVSELLWRFGFQENRRKTQIIPPGARKIVTGLVVNNAVPNVPRELRDTVRQHIYYCGKYGIEAHAKRRNFKSSEGFRAYLWGLIHYVESVNSSMGSAFRKQFELVSG